MTRRRSILLDRFTWREVLAVLGCVVGSVVTAFLVLPPILMLSAQVLGGLLMIASVPTFFGGLCCIAALFVGEFRGQQILWRTRLTTFFCGPLLVLLAWGLLYAGGVVQNWGGGPIKFTTTTSSHDSDMV